MTQSAAFGVVGGYGATGKAVVSHLRESCDGEIQAGVHFPADAVSGAFMEELRKVGVEVTETWDL
jgi:7-keto-8-aminopelargonate synthetase-like enzyme